jgi:hypothetical protein
MHAVGAPKYERPAQLQRCTGNHANASRGIAQSAVVMTCTSLGRCHGHVCALSAEHSFRNRQCAGVRYAQPVEPVAVFLQPKARRRRVVHFMAPRSRNADAVHVNREKSHFQTGKAKVQGVFVAETRLFDFVRLLVA